ncbi:hypothetical protein RND71_039795 [Anisodus tanguticus]|uniref:Uncharacterized protein n=1 Tax=Anisodus tanguticus TaxID=243964 RepID=A0AAE1QWF8_9SOLA|nr:hypothetical protein RND71_039795 [Anisodus tanguticus]
MMQCRSHKKNKFADFDFEEKEQSSEEEGRFELLMKCVVELVENGMMGDKEMVKKKKKKRSGSKRRMTSEQSWAYNCDSEWVKVLSLTDHDTMSGIPEALEAASRFGIKIIPGVEISTMFSHGSQGCGPAKFDQVDKFLSSIRDGRFIRAENMILKFNKLKLPLKWEQVAKIAGKGVAPGRLHVARAMVEAGHVENLKQAFSRYLYDGGPAYATGSEPLAEEAVQFICETGGVAVLAHPWALKDPIAVVRRLKEVGLHGIEACRSDAKLAAYSDLADAYDLLKLGGSDFHGRGGKQESDVGSVGLPVLAVNEFLKVARPIWCRAITEILENYIKYPSETNLQLMSFGKPKVCRGISPASCPGESISRCLSFWLTNEERQNAEFEAIKLKLAATSVNQ